VAQQCVSTAETNLRPFIRIKFYTALDTTLSVRYVLIRGASLSILLGFVAGLTMGFLVFAFSIIGY
jgi:hypothetical protein